MADVLLYTAHAELTPETPGVAALLSPDRLAAAERLRDPRARACSVTADLVLRAAARAFDPAVPLPLVRAADAHGKPCLPALPDFAFSLSHSGGRVLCAVADTPVGADIELPRPVRPGLPARYCTPEEQAMLSAHPDWFFDLWMCKEAVMKCCGLGLSLPIREIPLTGFPSPRLAAPVRGVRYALALVPLPDGTRCAVCVPGDTPPSVSVRPLAASDLL